MSNKVNPFRPGHPVRPGMFAGRLDEIQRISAAVHQTSAGRPVNFMMIGERGIGKSSLMLYAKVLATLGLEEEGREKFLVIDTDLDRHTTQLGLIRKIEMGLRHGLATSEPARRFLQNAWQFLQRVEAGGLALKPTGSSEPPEAMMEEFSYSLAQTVNRICAEPAEQNVFDSTYSGVLLLIDEADNAASDLQLGSFLKLLLERVQRRDCDHLMVGLAGLPELRTVLRDSHPSSVRLFEEMELDRLTPADVRTAVNQALAVAERENGRSFQVTDDGVASLVSLSEGFPHFLQQFGYSAFETDSDDVIDAEDVFEGAAGKGGALDLIGNQYYRSDFYEKIKKDSYRQVLRIMAEHLDAWVTKKEIRERFKGKNSTLDNAIYALRRRDIIVTKEGSRGIYRLRNKGFALWVKLYTTNPTQLAFESIDNGTSSSDH